MAKEQIVGKEGIYQPDNPIITLANMGIITQQQARSFKPSQLPWSWADLVAGRFISNGNSKTSPGPTIGNVFGIATRPDAEQQYIRTGHLGGRWKRIMAGGGNQLAINRTHLEHNLGRAVLFDLNQAAGDSRDALYEPHATYQHGQRIELPILSWNGQGFKQVEPGKDVLTPFAMTVWQNQIMPLTTFHEQDLQEAFKDVSPEKITTFCRELIKQEPVVRNFLVKYLEFFSEVVREDHVGGELKSANEALSRLIDRSVTNGGIIEKATKGNPTLSYNLIGKIRFNGREYDPHEIADLILTPIKIAAQPELLHHVAELGSKFPYLSTEAIAAFMAVFKLDYNSPKLESTSPTTELQLHFHGGAFDMAGTWTQPGYFADRAGGTAAFLQHARVAMGKTDGKNNLPGIAYILAPAGALTLCPNKCYPDDVGALEELIARVFNACSDSQKLALDKIAGAENLAIQQTVSDWLKEYSSRLSYGFKSRINPSLPDEFVDDPSTVFPDGMDNLTVRQAMMIVGHLRNFGATIN